MSFYCDWCGEEIAESRGRVTLKAQGMFVAGELIHDERRHFHAGFADDEDSCLLRAIRLIDDRDPHLENIPTVSARRIDQIRSKHHRRGGERDERE